MGYLHKDTAPLFMIIVPCCTCKEPFLQKCFYFIGSKERCTAPQEVIGSLQRKLRVPCLLYCCNPFTTWISFSNKCIKGNELAVRVCCWPCPRFSSANHLSICLTQSAEAHMSFLVNKHTFRQVFIPYNQGPTLRHFCSFSLQLCEQGSVFWDSAFRWEKTFPSSDRLSNKRSHDLTGAAILEEFQSLQGRAERRNGGNTTLKKKKKNKQTTTAKKNPQPSSPSFCCLDLELPQLIVCLLAQPWQPHCKPAQQGRGAQQYPEGPNPEGILGTHLPLACLQDHTLQECSHSCFLPLNAAGGGGDSSASAFRSLSCNNPRMKALSQEVEQWALGPPQPQGFRVSISHETILNTELPGEGEISGTGRRGGERIHFLIQTMPVNREEEMEELWYPKLTLQGQHEPVV